MNTKSQIIAFHMFIILPTTKQTNLETVLSFTGLLTPFLASVFGSQGDAAAVVQILH